MQAGSANGAIFVIVMFWHFTMHVLRLTCLTLNCLCLLTFHVSRSSDMKIHCPTCKKVTTWEENPFRPFCSERCKLVDLGAWASEGYRIPAVEGDQEDERNDLSDEENQK